MLNNYEQSDIFYADNEQRKRTMLFIAFNFQTTPLMSLNQKF